jgi:hypothetical protein
MRSILAVASNTVKQALRMKVALVFVVLLLVLLPLLALSASGDGSMKGRLQTFVSYGVSLTSLLLSLLTLFTAIYTTTSDLVHKQVYTVLTKPLRRYEFLLGKFFGILFLDVVLLILFSGIIYGIVVLAPRYVNVSAQEQLELNDQFYTARARMLPKPVAVTEEEVEAKYQQLEHDQVLDQKFDKHSPGKLKDYLRNQLRMSKNAVAVGAPHIWEFNNIKPLDPNEELFLRFKFDVAVTPPDEQFYSRWTVGDDRPSKRGEKSTTPIRFYDRKDPVRTFREFPIPARVVAKDGYLAVGFLNVPQLNQTTVIFSEGKRRNDKENESLVLLYKAGTFRGNFFKAMLLIFFRLVFLAGLAILSATFLSFPVAALLALVVFLTVSVSGFILESFGYLGDALQQVYGSTIELIIKGLPQFDKYSPSEYLIDAQLIDWYMIHWASWTLLWALVLLGLGLAIFSFKELASDTS